MSDYGEKGYLTPDDVPEDRHCRIFRIPDSTQWLSVFMGALLPLIDPESWQEYGDLTPDEAADAALDVIWDAYNNNYCSLDLPAPYWDLPSADDADDESPVDDQVWYGELVPAASFSAFDVEDDPEPEFTWRENASIWIVTAFVAYAATPAAAVAFYPLARKFVLAFKAHDLGGIVKILWDGNEITRLDTYSPSDSVVSASIILPEGGDMPPLWVAMADEVNPAVEGDPNIQVLRKRLDPDEVYPDNLRYDAECDCIQQTYDGGTTWVDNPGQDPRHSTTYLYPPVVADDPKCQAAANEVRFLNNVIDGALGVMSEGATLLSLGLFILALVSPELGPFAILFDVVLALADILLSAGGTAIGNAFTNEVYDQLTCIFYCAINDDGTVTAAELSNIEDEIASDIGGLAQLVLDAMLLLTGEVGLSNAGTMGDAPADCSACECCEDSLDGHGPGSWTESSVFGCVTEYDATGDLFQCLNRGDLNGNPSYPNATVSCSIVYGLAGVTKITVDWEVNCLAGSPARTVTLKNATTGADIYYNQANTGGLTSGQNIITFTAQPDDQLVRLVVAGSDRFGDPMTDGSYAKITKLRAC